MSVYKMIKMNGERMWHTLPPSSERALALNVLMTESTFGFSGGSFNTTLFYAVVGLLDRNSHTMKLIRMQEVKP